MNKVVLGAEDKATYKAILEGVAANPDIGVVANRYPWQTKMAIEKLLDYAKDKLAEIRLLTGGCPEGFYSVELASKFKDCKRAGCPSIKILVWQEKTEGISPALIKLATDNIIELQISGTNKFADKVPHFLLVGDSAFRQEAAHVPFQKETTFTETSPLVPARIDFNDKGTGQALAVMFDKIWSLA